MAFAHSLASNGLSYFLYSLAYLTLGFILLLELKRGPLRFAELAALRILAIYGFVRGFFYFGELFFLIAYQRTSPLAAGLVHELIWVAADYLTVIIFFFFAIKLLTSINNSKRSLYTVAIGIGCYWITILVCGLNAGLDFTKLATWHELKPFFLCIPSFFTVAIGFKHLGDHYRSMGALQYSQNFLWLARAYGIQTLMIFLSASAHVTLIPHIHNPRILTVTGNDPLMRCILALGMFIIVYLLYRLLSYTERLSNQGNLNNVQENLVAELAYSLVDQICDVLEIDSASVFLKSNSATAEESEQLIAAQGLPFRAPALTSSPVAASSIHSELQKTYKTVSTIPIETATERIGSIVVANKRRRPLAPQEQHFLHSLAEQTGRTINGIRLVIDDIEVKAIQEERLRISREMHDGISPLLAYVRFKIEMAKELLEENDRNPVAHTLEEIDEVIKDAFSDVRDSISGLRCSLNEGSLCQKITACLQQFQKLSQAQVICNCPDNLPELQPKQEVQVIRIIQEALTNIRKHAAATKVTVNVSCSEGKLSISIADNGNGFDTTKETPEGHYGLASMQERSSEINSSLQISSQIGYGTTVSLVVPLNGKEITHNDQSSDSRRSRAIPGGSGQINFVQS